MTTTKPIRCAIYTRKSTEEGLEQAFNSLDAQREACVAYVDSQRHEGWLLSPELYDDGGFSGGNMNRPGLTALMAEVKAGRIQVIVVYKVDRLTRSLADFAKIVDVLDAAGASFVSVTQSFNTTTSMGRLTLNVLLSFAQFEREVSGERIRDKIAASKRKGMWMGGPVPLGYDVRDRKLIVNEPEAATVRLVFQRYLELGSVVATTESLNREGVLTKITRTGAGLQRGGGAWSRGAVGHLLLNPVYIGQVRHKDHCFPGEQASIISPEVWASVQAQFGTNRVTRKQARNLAHRNLLGGLLFDGLGRRMRTGQSNKGPKRYHYYQTAPEPAAKPAGAIWRVPAHDTETIVVMRLRAFLNDTAALDAAFAARSPSAEALELSLCRARSLSDAMDQDLSASRTLLRRIDLHDDRLDISICLAGFYGESSGADPYPSATPEAIEPQLHQISVPVSRLRRSREVRLIISDAPSDSPTTPDPSLLRLIATARTAQAAMLAAGDQRIADVAKGQGISERYFLSLLRLATLDPSIVQAILDGRQPPSLTRLRLARITNMPIDWAEQRSVLGFV
jgi:site-specific DNA recombinase